MEQIENKKRDNPSGWLEEVLLPIEIVVEDYPRINLSSKSEAINLLQGKSLSRSPPKTSFRFPVDDASLRPEERYLFQEKSGGLRVGLWLGKECIGIGEHTNEGVVILRKPWNIDLVRNS